PRTAVLLGNHCSQPSGLHQGVNKRFRIRFLFIHLAEILIRKLPAQLSDGVANVLKLVLFLVHVSLLDHSIVQTRVVFVKYLLHLSASSETYSEPRHGIAAT